MESIVRLASTGEPPIVAETAAARWRRALPLACVSAVALACAIAILVYGNPAPFGSQGFWIIAQSRLVSLGTIALVAVSQGLATVIFHTATANRILTPSILGFDALYVLMQTALVYVFGTAAVHLEGIPKIVIQSALMVLFATLLYGWLFSGRLANLHLLLLVGVVLGIGFGSVSMFMQRTLTPSEFDVLSARLFGSIGRGNPDYLPIAAALVLIVLGIVWARRRTYDVVALGKDTAIGLGVDYRSEVIGILVMVSVLVSVSATMVGPMTFYGFLVATLAYQFSRGDGHAEVIPMAIAIGLATLLLATFVLKHVFAAGGLVTVIIEFGGGLLFLTVLLRKGLR